MGDGMLVEFASVVDAVRAAVEIQHAVALRNADLPADKRIVFRFGINLGDVVVDGDDIQGDGVNVAARLEGLAEPGGICLSGGAYDQVRDRVDVPFEDMGNHQVWTIFCTAILSSLPRSLAANSTPGKLVQRQIRHHAGTAFATVQYDPCLSA